MTSTAVEVALLSSLATELAIGLLPQYMEPKEPRPMDVTYDDVGGVEPAASDMIATEARRMGASGLKVSAICPGFVDTGMIEGNDGELINPFAGLNNDGDCFDVLDAETLTFEATALATGPSRCTRLSRRCRTRSCVPRRTLRHRSASARRRR